MNNKQSINRYALIIGNGRSGTNWLLSMLDASPQTHCRNEPQDIPSSPFHGLPHAQHLQNEPEEMAHRWETFAKWTGTHMGERDHRIKAPKHHVYPISQRLGVAYWPVRPKIRKALKFVWPALNQGEWLMPWWIGRQEKLSQAYGIFKVNDLRAWYVLWLLNEYPHLPIVHIVRHPGGQLNSGINRFFSNLSEHQLEQERQLYIGILETAVQLDPSWQDVFGNIRAMELIEAVAWFWRYNNEEIFKAGQSCKNYMFLTYEQLARDPIGYAKRIYDFCDIPWNYDVQAEVTSGLSTSMWGKLSKKSNDIADNWKSTLELRHRVLAARVLENSLLEDCWEK